MRNKLNSLHFEFDLPGFKRDEIKVEFDENMLQISALREHEHEDMRGDYTHREKRSSVFSYEASLPSDIDRKNTQVEFKDGVLTVEIPKKEA